MIQKASELRLKEVISVNDGKKLGNIYDMELDTETGQIKSVIIPGGGKLLGFFHIVPKVRSTHLLFVFCRRFFFAGDVKETS